MLNPTGEWSRGSMDLFENYSQWRHFGTYKMVPGQPNHVEILGLHGAEETLAVVAAAVEDYDETYSRRPQEAIMSSDNSR
jgi:hypothetical protein